MVKVGERTATRLLWGAASGAVGTAALNAATYGDMLLRGRPASGVPAKAAGILVERLGLAPLLPEHEEVEAGHRREAAGALLDYATGVGVGVAYALVRVRTGPVPRLGAGVFVGLAAMGAGDAPIVLSGASDHPSS